MQVAATPVARVGHSARTLSLGESPARCWLKKWIG
jgi:hypothetical protein